MRWVPFNLNESDVFALVLNTNDLGELTDEVVVEVVGVLNQDEIVDGVDFILIFKFLVFLVDFSQWQA